MPRTTSARLAAVPTPPADPAPAFVTLDAGGAYLGVHPVTIRRAISRGELPGYAFGKPGTNGPGMKGVRVRLADLDAWAESRTIPSGRVGTGVPTVRAGR